MKKLLLLLIVVIVFAGSAYAADKGKRAAATTQATEPKVWIEPGDGGAGLRIGSNQNDVTATLGPPIDVSGTKLFYFFDYNGIRVAMDRGTQFQAALDKMGKGKEPKSDWAETPGEVHQITFYSPNAKTRGDISVGSSLNDVLKVFGDTQYRKLSNLKAVNCASAQIVRATEGQLEPVTWQGFTGYALVLHYNDGVSFYFKIDGQAAPTVYAINVSRRSECTKAWDFEKKKEE